jgi:hypothetical protein
MTPENIGNYQEKRVARREKRGVKKGEGTFDTSGNYLPTDANSKFNKKTELIAAKATKNKSNTNTKQQQAMADCILAGGTYKNGVCS